jgi:hypothetical protein
MKRTMKKTAHGILPEKVAIALAGPKDQIDLEVSEVLWNPLSVIGENLSYTSDNKVDEFFDTTNQLLEVETAIKTRAELFKEIVDFKLQKYTTFVYDFQKKIPADTVMKKFDVHFEYTSFFQNISWINQSTEVRYNWTSSHGMQREQIIGTFDFLAQTIIRLVLSDNYKLPSSENIDTEFPSYYNMYRRRKADVVDEIFYFINENYNFNKLFKMAKKDVTLRKGLLFPNFDKHLDGLEDLKNTSGVREAVDKYHKELKDDKDPSVNKVQIYCYVRLFLILHTISAPMNSNWALSFNLKLTEEQKTQAMQKTTGGAGMERDDKLAEMSRINNILKEWGNLFDDDKYKDLRGLLPITVSVIGEDDIFFAEKSTYVEVNNRINYYMHPEKYCDEEYKELRTGPTWITHHNMMKDFFNDILNKYNFFQRISDKKMDCNDWLNLLNRPTLQWYNLDRIVDNATAPNEKDRTRHDDLREWLVLNWLLINKRDLFTKLIDRLHRSEEHVAYKKLKETEKATSKAIKSDTQTMANTTKYPYATVMLMKMRALFLNNNKRKISELRKDAESIKTHINNRFSLTEEILELEQNVIHNNTKTIEQELERRGIESDSVIITENLEYINNICNNKSQDILKSTNGITDIKIPEHYNLLTRSFNGFLGNANIEGSTAYQIIKYYNRDFLENIGYITTSTINPENPEIKWNVNSKRAAFLLLAYGYNEHIKSTADVIDSYNLFKFLTTVANDFDRRSAFNSPLTRPDARQYLTISRFSKDKLPITYVDGKTLTIRNQWRKKEMNEDTPPDKVRFLYHGVGTGKTITSLICALNHMDDDEYKTIDDKSCFDTTIRNGSEIHTTSEWKEYMKNLNESPYKKNQNVRYIDPKTQKWKPAMINNAIDAAEEDAKAASVAVASKTEYSIRIAGGHLNNIKHIDIRPMDNVYTILIIAPSGIFINAFMDDGNSHLNLYTHNNINVHIHPSQTKGNSYLIQKAFGEIKSKSKERSYKIVFYGYDYDQLFKEGGLEALEMYMQNKKIHYLIADEAHRFTLNKLTGDGSNIDNTTHEFKFNGCDKTNVNTCTHYTHTNSTLKYNILANYNIKIENTSPTHIANPVIVKNPTQNTFDDDMFIKFLSNIKRTILLTGTPLQYTIDDIKNINYFLNNIDLNTCNTIELYNDEITQQGISQQRLKDGSIFTYKDEDASDFHKTMPWIHRFMFRIRSNCKNFRTPGRMVVDVVKGGGDYDTPSPEKINIVTDDVYTPDISRIVRMLRDWIVGVSKHEDIKYPIVETRFKVLFGEMLDKGGYIWKYLEEISPDDTMNKDTIIDFFSAFFLDKPINKTPDITALFKQPEGNYVVDPILDRLTNMSTTFGNAQYISYGEFLIGIVTCKTVKNIENKVDIVPSEINLIKGLFHIYDYSTIYYKKITTKNVYPHNYNEQTKKDVKYLQEKYKTKEKNDFAGYNVKKIEIPKFDYKAFDLATFNKNISEILIDFENMERIINEIILWSYRDNPALLTKETKIAIEMFGKDKIYSLDTSDDAFSTIADPKDKAITKYFLMVNYVYSMCVIYTSILHDLGNKDFNYNDIVETVKEKLLALYGDIVNIEVNSDDRKPAMYLTDIYLRLIKGVLSNYSSQLMSSDNANINPNNLSFSYVITSMLTAENKDNTFGYCSTVNENGQDISDGKKIGGNNTAIGAGAVIMLSVFVFFAPRAQSLIENLKRQFIKSYESQLNRRGEGIGTTLANEALALGKKLKDIIISLGELLTIQGINTTVVALVFVVGQGLVTQDIGVFTSSETFVKIIQNAFDNLDWTTFIIAFGAYGVSVAAAAADGFAKMFIENIYGGYHNINNLTKYSEKLVSVYNYDYNDYPINRDEYLNRIECSNCESLDKVEVIKDGTKNAFPEKFMEYIYIPYNKQSLNNIVDKDIQNEFVEKIDGTDKEKRVKLKIMEKIVPWYSIDAINNNNDLNQIDKNMLLQIVMRYRNNMSWDCLPRRKQPGLTPHFNIRVSGYFKKQVENLVVKIKANPKVTVPDINIDEWEGKEQELLYNLYNKYKIDPKYAIEAANSLVKTEETDIETEEARIAKEMDDLKVSDKANLKRTGILSGYFEKPDAAGIRKTNAATREKLIDDEQKLKARKQKLDNEKEAIKPETPADVEVAPVADDILVEKYTLWEGKSMVNYLKAFGLDDTSAGKMNKKLAEGGITTPQTLGKQEEGAIMKTLFMPPDFKINDQRLFKDAFSYAKSPSVTDRIGNIYAQSKVVVGSMVSPGDPSSNKDEQKFHTDSELASMATNPDTKFKQNEMIEKMYKLFHEPITSDQLAKLGNSIIKIETIEGSKKYKKIIEHKQLGSRKSTSINDPCSKTPHVECDDNKPKNTPTKNTPTNDDKNYVYVNVKKVKEEEASRSTHNSGLGQNIKENFQEAVNGIFGMFKSGASSNEVVTASTSPGGQQQITAAIEPSQKHIESANTPSSASPVVKDVEEIEYINLTNTLLLYIPNKVDTVGVNQKGGDQPSNEAIKVFIATQIAALVFLRSKEQNISSVESRNIINDVSNKVMNYIVKNKDFMVNAKTALTAPKDQELIANFLSTLYRKIERDQIYTIKAFEELEPNNMLKGGGMDINLIWEWLWPFLIVLFKLVMYSGAGVAAVAAVTVLIGSDNVIGYAELADKWINEQKGFNDVIESTDKLKMLNEKIQHNLSKIDGNGSASGAPKDERKYKILAANFLNEMNKESKISQQDNDNDVLYIKPDGDIGTMTKDEEFKSFQTLREQSEIFDQLQEKFETIINKVYERLHKIKYFMSSEQVRIFISRSPDVQISAHTNILTYMEEEYKLRDINRFAEIIHLLKIIRCGAVQSGFNENNDGTISPNYHFHPHYVNQKDKVEYYLPLVYPPTREIMHKFVKELEDKKLNYLWMYSKQGATTSDDINRVDKLLNGMVSLGKKSTFPLAPYTDDNEGNENPICVILSPDHTEGFSFIYNPAIICLSLCDTAGDFEQVCGRILRKYNHTSPKAEDEDFGRYQKKIYQIYGGSNTSESEHYNIKSAIQKYTNVSDNSHIWRIYDPSSNTKNTFKKSSFRALGRDYSISDKTTDNISYMIYSAIKSARDGTIQKAKDISKIVKSLIPTPKLEHRIEHAIKKGENVNYLIRSFNNNTNGDINIHEYEHISYINDSIVNAGKYFTKLIEKETTSMKMGEYITFKPMDIELSHSKEKYNIGKDNILFTKCVPQRGGNKTRYNRIKNGKNKTHRIKQKKTINKNRKPKVHKTKNKRKKGKK